MLAHRSPERRVDPRRLLAELQPLLGPGGRAHARNVELLIAAGELEAALADALLPDEEAPADAVDAARAITLAAARLACRSWDGAADGAADDADLREALAAHEALLALPLPPELRVGVPAGHAWQALYPEAYAAAADRLWAAHRPARVVVVGLRGVGAGLSAVVAERLAAHGADVQSCTVRARGTPADRRVRATPAFVAPLAAHVAGGAYVCLVDDGPGPSGSSLASAAELAERLGARDDRVHFFPGHDADPAGFPGARVRERWARHARWVATFDETWVAAGRLAAALPAGRLEELSGGRWRDRAYPDPRDRPAVQPAHERRKYLVTPAGGGPALLAKFAGLGAHGRRSLGRAERLAAEGLSPPVRGLREGFLLTEWVPGEPAAWWEADESLIHAAARHAAFVHRRFETRLPVPWESLWAMTAHNVGELLGPAWAARLAPLRHLERLVRAGRVAEVDGRMLPHEWVRTAGGWLKADAVDHGDDGFWPGPQDAAWDVAGAIVELGLDDARARRLASAYARLAGDAGARGRLPFYVTAYLAARAGYLTVAADALAEGDADGRALRRERARHLALLRSLLLGLGGELRPQLPPPYAGARLVVFDADDALRRAAPDAAGAAPWELLPGVQEALVGLRWGVPGLRLAAASDQVQAGDGRLSERQARRAVAATLAEATGAVPEPGAIELCPHAAGEPCRCRVPAGEMLRRLVWRHGVGPAETLFVASAERGRQAARDAGTRFAWAPEFFDQLRAAAVGAPPDTTTNATRAAGSRAG